MIFIFHKLFAKAFELRPNVQVFEKNQIPNYLINFLVKLSGNKLQVHNPLLLPTNELRI